MIVYVCNGICFVYSACRFRSKAFRSMYAIARKWGSAPNVWTIPHRYKRCIGQTLCEPKFMNYVVLKQNNCKKNSNLWIRESVLQRCFLGGVASTESRSQPSKSYTYHISTVVRQLFLFDVHNKTLFFFFLLIFIINYFCS